MKNLTDKISIISILINSLCYSEYSYANQFHNSNKKTSHVLINNDELINSKIYSFKSTNIDIKNYKSMPINNEIIGNSHKHKKIYVPKMVTYKSSNTNNFNSSTIKTKKFESNFKDLSSTFTSNYGAPITRAPDESLKNCTTKAGFE